MESAMEQCKDECESTDLTHVMVCVLPKGHEGMHSNGKSSQWSNPIGKVSWPVWAFMRFARWVKGIPSFDRLPRR
jgi:hypothetical protein